MRRATRDPMCAADRLTVAASNEESLKGAAMCVTTVRRTANLSAADLGGRVSILGNQAGAHRYRPRRRPARRRRFLSPGRQGDGKSLEYCPLPPFGILYTEPAWGSVLLEVLWLDWDW